MIEGSFSILERGMKGVYQHCAEKHLHRYLAEFDFRYNHRVSLGHSDIDPTKAAIKGTDGKRLHSIKLIDSSKKFVAARARCALLRYLRKRK